MYFSFRNSWPSVTKAENPEIKFLELCITKRYLKVTLLNFEFKFFSWPPVNNRKN